MKDKYYYLTILTLFVVVSSFGQNTVSTKQQRRQAAKVDTVYTVEERANMAHWLYERVNEMKLSDEVREEYDAIIFSRIYDMSRLNDKDKAHTDEEIHIKFDEIVDKMNMEVKAILTTDQYINHLENFAELERSVYKKFDWDND
ncbi:hypothetical protein [Hanstruepera ponticola]|uniref:hypothetical protein n=1 Tax=Hanstruepera ponticola TaxID=2042995 RepID=UPI000CF19603|nr:hypothetical protein [Hanstruepera ponticola]